MPHDLQVYDMAGGESLAHWQRAGGFDAETFLYGRWGDRAADDSWVNNIASHYSYRNVPVGFERPYCYYWQRTGTGAPHTKLAFTKPAVPLITGAPAFPTQRILGGRALVSDTFSKGSRFDALGQQKTGGNDLSLQQLHPGMGLLAHKTVYNVLYGDGHVKAHNDPQMQIAYHMEGRGSKSNCGRSASATVGYKTYPTSGDATVLNLLAHFSFLTGGPTPDTSGRFDARKMSWKVSSAKVWNDLDTAAGADVFDQNKEHRY